MSARLLRSSSPPKRGRHLQERDDPLRRVRVAILVPSEEGTPRAAIAAALANLSPVAILVPSEEGTPPDQLRRVDAPLTVVILVPSEEGTPPRAMALTTASHRLLRSSSPPKRGRHPRTTCSPLTRSRCDPRPLRRGDATRDQREQRPQPLDVAILVPSEEGTPPAAPASPCPCHAPGCDPRPLRRGDATGRTTAWLRWRRVAILVPSEEGTPPGVGKTTLTGQLVLRSSSPPKRGRHPPTKPTNSPSKELRSSSPPKRGRHLECWGTGGG